MAGLRIATVSTVALTTVGVLVGHGGLGQLIVGGFNANFYRAEIVTGALGCVLLALLVDLLLGRRRAAADAVVAGGAGVNDFSRRDRLPQRPAQLDPADGGILDLLGRAPGDLGGGGAAPRWWSRCPIGVVLGTSGRGGGLRRRAVQRQPGRPDAGAAHDLRGHARSASATAATTIALAVFAIPPILTNTFVGFREVDRRRAGGGPRDGHEPRAR